MKTLLKISIYLGTLILIGVGILFFIAITSDYTEFPNKTKFLDLWPSLGMFALALIFYISGRYILKK